MRTSTTNPPRIAESIANVGAFANMAQLAHISRTRRVWLRVGQLIDGVSARPHRDANIVFDAKRIHFVGAGDELPDKNHLAPSHSTPDVVLPDATLLPTLIEAHAHLFLDGALIGFEERENYLKHPADWMLTRARNRFPKILQAGVGAIRDAGDKHGVGLALAADAKSANDNRCAAPHLDSPGAAIHHRGRYGEFMGQPLEDFRTPADCVAARVAAGADRIKLLVSGIINFKVGRVTAPPQMSTDEVAALVAAARSCVRQTFAHASGKEGIENSIAGGVTTVEHGYFITADQLARMRDRQIGWVPTFAPVALQLNRATDLGWDAKVSSHLEYILAGHAEMLRHAHAIGVPIIAGSDAGSCGVPHGLGLLDELVHMETAGLSPWAVIQSATSASARMLDFPDSIGCIAPGSRARMIVTNHDPLQTVANLRKDKMILFDGEAIQAPTQIAPDGL